MSEVTKIPEQYCLKHAKPYEYFCIEHDVLVCKECLDVLHQGCKNVMSVDKASKGAKQSDTLRDLIKSMKQISEVTDTLTKERKENLESIEKKAEMIRSTVQATKQDLILHLDSLEKSLLEDVIKTKTKILSVVKETINDANIVKTQVNEKLEILDAIEKFGSDKQAFIISYNVTKDVAESEHKLMCLIDNATIQTIDFSALKMNNEIMSIGSITVSETPSKLKYVPVKMQQSQFPVVASMPTFVYDHDVFLTEVKGGVAISGMLINKNNELVMCDCSNSRILIYDEYKYSHKIKTRFKPWDIAVIPNENTAVTTSNGENYIQFIDFDSKKILSEMNLDDSSGGGISISTEYIFVGAKGKIHVLDHKGISIRKIIINQTDGTPWFMTLRKNGFICFSLPTELTCIKPDGETVFTYKSPDLRKCFDIQTDSYDNLYVVDNYNSAIHRLRSDGEYLDVLKYEALKRPISLCFNSDNTKMYVSVNTGRYLSLFKLT